MNIEERVRVAYETHHEGYNCAQAVFAAYLDLLDISKEDAMKTAYGFGGGLGMTREICGTLTFLNEKKQTSSKSVFQE